MPVAVVGGGVLGFMHALEARRRGHPVTHLEREPGSRGASVRNFGLIWVSGRASSADSGAPSSRTRGLMASARSSATRCCCPPDSRCGYCLAWAAPVGPDGESSRQELTGRWPVRGWARLFP